MPGTRDIARRPPGRVRMWVYSFTVREGRIAMYFVYILRNPDRRSYISQTNNLVRRIQEQNDQAFSRAVATCIRRKYDIRSEALRRERQRMVALLKDVGGC